MTLELAYRCNLRCVFCSRWNELDDLSLESITQIAEDMATLRADYVSLSGGDPFVRTDIKEIIETFVKQNVPIHINTNGVLLRRYSEFLKSRADSIIGITVSMDSITPEGHDEIRGVEGTFRKAMAGMESVRDSIPVSLACTLNQINLHEIETYSKFAREHDYPFRFQPLHDDSENQLSPNQEGVTVEEDQLDGLTERLEAVLTHDDRFPTRQYYRLFEPFFRNQTELNSLRCVAAARSIYFVDPKGGVFPCDTRRDIELGNVYTDRFADIVKGDRASTWRNTCRDGQNGCWCMYACVAPTNLHNQFLPLVPVTRRGWPIRNRWKKLERLVGMPPVESNNKETGLREAQPNSIKEWPIVTIVMATYNGGETFLRSLETTLALDYPSQKREVVVVNDGSDDGSIETAMERFSRVISCGELRFVDHDKPTGVPAAYNRGVRASSLEARYILKLDNDVELQPDALSRLVACAEANPNAGIVGGSVFFRADPQRVQFAGGYLTSPWRGPEKLTTPFDSDPPLNSEIPVRVDLINSCMALVRRGVFERSGLFPEEYGLYEYEDYDFAFAARQKGFLSVYCPGAVAHHDVSATSRLNAMSDVRARLRVRNGLLFMWRFAPRSWRISYITYNIAKLPIDVVRGRLPLFPALKGWADGINAIRTPVPERERLETSQP